MSENLPQVITESTTAISVLEVKTQVAAMHGLFKDVMQHDVHYGTIPGTPKPTLFKAGAEKIALLLRLAPSFERQMNWDGPHLTVISECTLIHGPTGKIIASAGAICTSRETKYAYRQGTRKCPECGATAIIKGKQEYGGGWLCFARKGGCGAKWPDGDKAIEGQSEEREENPNLPDTYNTVMKMADKRAFVAATLFGTAASDIYTQDVEDFAGNVGQSGDRVGRITPAQHARMAILLKEGSVPMDEVRGWLNNDYGVESRTELNETQAAEIIQRLEANPAPDTSYQNQAAADDTAENVDEPFPLPRQMRNEEAERPWVFKIRKAFGNAGKEHAHAFFDAEDGLAPMAQQVTDPDERRVISQIASHWMGRKVGYDNIWPEVT